MQHCFVADCCTVPMIGIRGATTFVTDTLVRVLRSSCKGQVLSLKLSASIERIAPCKLETFLLNNSKGLQILRRVFSE